MFHCGVSVIGNFRPPNHSDIETPTESDNSKIYFIMLTYTMSLKFQCKFVFLFDVIKKHKQILFN